MRIRLSASDCFHRIIDGQIRRDGGPGNLGQLLVRCAGPVDADGLARAWRALGTEVPLVAARIIGGLRGPRWRVPATASLELQRSDLPLDDLARHELRAAGHGLMRLACSAHGTDAGVVLTWNHQLCDARGAQGLLAALPRLAAGGRLGEPWRARDYRHDPEVPLHPAARGALARAAVALLKPLRRRRLLRPAGDRRHAAAPVDVHHRVLATAEAARVDARARAAAGRFSETSFLLAAVAAAIEQVAPDAQAGGLVFPVAVDLRKPAEPRLLANCHGFLMLGLDAGLASRDLGAAARALKEAHRAWLAADGVSKLLAAISWFPFAGSWFPRYQLGFGRAGLAASCLVANTGAATLTGTWFGAAVRGIDHLAVPPGQPGVAVLFHRDGRGLGFAVVITGALARRCPPARLADAIVAHLLDRPFPTTP